MIVDVFMGLSPEQSIALILSCLFGSFVLVYIALSPKKTDEELMRIKRTKRQAKENKDFVDRLADGTFTDRLTVMSYKAPCRWFIDETETSVQALRIKNSLSEAQLYNALSYRTFTVLKVVAGVSGMAAMGILLLFANNIPVLFPALTTAGSGDFSDVKLFIVGFCGVLSMFPSIWLAGQARAVKSMRSKDLPVLQLFLTLSLRTGRSIREIFRSLGTLNTRYRGIFKTAFLIHLRSEADAFEYLREEFINTRFEHTVRALANMGDYSREETIAMLENSMDDIMAENRFKQEKKNIINLFLTQGSLLLPLIALGLLVLYPAIGFVVASLGTQSF